MYTFNNTQLNEWCAYYINNSSIKWHKSVDQVQFIMLFNMISDLYI